MTIKKLVAGAKGASGNSTGADIADAVNGLIDGAQFQPSKYAPLINIFKSVSDITSVTGSPVIEYGTAPNGMTGIKITASSSVAVRFNQATGQFFNGEMALYCLGGKSTNIDSVTLRAYEDAGLTKQNFRQFVFGSNPINNFKEQGGAICIYNSQASFGKSGSPSASYTIADSRMTIAPTSGQTGELWIFGVAYSFKKRKSRICVTIDDGYSSVISLGQPVFDAAGIPTTLGVVPTAVDGNFAGYMSKDDLLTYVSGGNCVVAHTSGDLIGTSTPDQFSANLAETNNWIKNNDLARKGFDQCYIWPLGKFQNSSGQTDYLDAAINYGVNISRGTNPFSQANQANIDALTKYNRLACPIIGHGWAGSTAGEATNISNIVNYINAISDTGGIDCFIIFHKFVPDSTPDESMDLSIRISDLRTIVNAIQTNIAAGKLDPVTMPDLAFSNSSYANQL
jgi:hypothetical protein